MPFTACRYLHPFQRYLRCSWRRHKNNYNHNYNTVHVPTKISVKLIYMYQGALQVAQMLLNSIGDTVTQLLNRSVVKRCVDGSWLTQLLLMLRSHRPVLHALCAVVCQLITHQAHTLSDCHAHALAAVTVHWNNYPDCSAGIKVQRPATADGSPQDGVPFVSHVLESLPLSTTANMSFTLMFAASYIIYSKMIGGDSSKGENQAALSDRELVTLRSADDSIDIIVPDRIVQLLSYLSPRLVRDFRGHSSSIGTSSFSETGVSYRFAAALVGGFLTHDVVQSALDHSRMSLESWVRSEIEVTDGDGLSEEWLSEYYDWVVWSGWHKPQSGVSPASGSSYFVGVLQVLTQAVLDHDMRYSQPSTCCCHVSQPFHHRSQHSRRHNVFSFLQASRLLLTSCMNLPKHIFH